MTTAQWRELIEAFVEGRLSADAFKRRFMEAFDAAVAVRGPTPQPVQTLAYTVQAYAGDPTARGHDVADDEQLLAACRAALSALPEEALARAEPGPPRPPETPPQVVVLPPTGAREDAGGPRLRAEARVYRVRWGALGAAGCLTLLALVVVGVLQFFAIAAQIDSALGWGPAPSTLAAVPLTFVPLLGSVIAFFGAKDVWGWAPLVAGAVFVVLPVLSMAGGWRRWRGGSRT